MTTADREINMKDRPKLEALLRRDKHWLMLFGKLHRHASAGWRVDTALYANLYAKIGCHGNIGWSENCDRRASIGWFTKLASAAVPSAVLLAVLLGCSSAHSPREESLDATGDKIDVFVGLPPYAYLVERIGGDRVRVGTLLEAGRDAHSFALSPKQSLALGRCQLLFIAGMPFESAIARRLHRAANIKVVDVAQGLRKLPTDCSHLEHLHSERSGERVAADATIKHTARESVGSERPGSSHQEHHEQTEASPAYEEDSHVGQCEHSHGEPAGDHSMDPHVWLSPLLLKHQAERIAAALMEVDPAHAPQYGANLESLLAELDAVHRRIRDRLHPYRGQAFYVFHPAFGYFADCYGLRQIAVEHGGKTPTQRQLRELIHRAAQDRPRAIFVQPQYDVRAAKVVADAIGAELVVIDDLAPDLLANLERLAEKMAAALSGVPTAPEGGGSP